MKTLEVLAEKGFHEDISEGILESNIMQFESSLFDMLANRVIFDIDLFDISMKRGVLSEDNAAVVIT